MTLWGWRKVRGRVRLRNVEHVAASRTLCPAKDVSDPFGEPLLPVPVGYGVHPSAWVAKLFGWYGLQRPPLDVALIPVSDGRVAAVVADGDGHLRFAVGAGHGIEVVGEVPPRRRSRSAALQRPADHRRAGCSRPDASEASGPQVPATGRPRSDSPRAELHRRGAAACHARWHWPIRVPGYTRELELPSAGELRSLPRRPSHRAGRDGPTARPTPPRPPFAPPDPEAAALAQPPREHRPPAPSPSRGHSTVPTALPPTRRMAGPRATEPLRYSAQNS